MRKRSRVERSLQDLPGCRVPSRNFGDVLGECPQPIVHSYAAAADRHSMYHLPEFRVDASCIARSEPTRGVRAHVVNVPEVHLLVEAGISRAEKHFVSFLPAACKQAITARGHEIRSWRIVLRSDKTFTDDYAAGRGEPGNYWPKPPVVPRTSSLTGDSAYLQRDRTADLG
jgi:hypothetical protein